MSYKGVNFLAGITIDQSEEGARLEIELFSIKKFFGVKRKQKFMHIEQIVSKQDLLSFVPTCKHIIQENIDFYHTEEKTNTAKPESDKNLYFAMMHQSSGVIG